MKTSTPGMFNRQRSAGHFVSLLQGNDNQTAMASYIRPGVRGFLKRYTWNKLEPVSGTYDMSVVESDLAWCQARGLKLVVMIVDKSFSGPTRNLPSDLAALEMRNAVGGYTAMRWTPAYIGAMNALTARLALYDGNEAFEGIATVETAPSTDMSVILKAGFTPELYRDAYINILLTAAKNLPQSQVFWFQNFFPGNQAYIAEIAEAVKSSVVLCGPDILPTNAQLVSTVYPTYAQMRGRMTIAAQMSNPGFSQIAPDGTLYTMATMLAYARDTMFVNYIFWMPTRKAIGAIGYGYEDAAAVIAANPVLNP